MLRYILPFCFENLNPRDYHGDSRSVMFPRFPTVSPGVSTCFSWCFYGFLRFFSGFPSLFLLFPPIVSPVSYFRFCESELCYGCLPSLSLIIFWNIINYRIIYLCSTMSLVKLLFLFSRSNWIKFGYFYESYFHALKP